MGALPTVAPTAAFGESDTASDTPLSSDTQQPKRDLAGVLILVLPAVAGGTQPSGTCCPGPWELEPTPHSSASPLWAESSLETAQTRLLQSHCAPSPEVRKVLREGIKPWQAGHRSGERQRGVTLRGAGSSMPDR